MELARARRYIDSLSLVILDVDHFKYINDTWGHPAGDAALHQIAGILREHTRVADLAARVGGEEMALILPRSETDQAAQLAERLRERIQQTIFLWEGNAMQLTCSFGICGGTGEMLPEESSEL
jgi:diguanylate cyclase (GGDEF)-like protein